MSRMEWINAWISWRFRRAQGWRLEGPFPHFKRSALLLCGPGLPLEGEWGRHLRMFKKYGTCTPKGDGGVQTATLAQVMTRKQLLELLSWAQQEQIDLHLVQRSCRHRRIRCNSSFKVGQHPDRVADYVERIFSYSGGCGDVNSTFPEGEQVVHI